MYMVYADESGDPGRGPGATDYYVLSGLVLHEASWNNAFQAIRDLRRGLAKDFGLRQRTELHAHEIVRGKGAFAGARCRLARRQRIKVYQRSMQTLAGMAGLQVLNVCIHKGRIKPAWRVDVFETAWRFFLQRCHAYAERNPKGGEEQYAVVFTDETQNDRLLRLMRKLRARNPVPSGRESENVPTSRLLDDPVPRASDASYFIQMADLVAFALGKQEYPSGTAATSGVERFFSLLDPVLLKDASRYSKQGVVHWPRRT